MIESCECQVPVPCPHCAHELPMGLRGRGNIKSRDFRESRRETQRRTCRLSLISSEMICSRLIALFLACFINCSHSAISVAKPSAAQAKYLDYEIGASIHFNMQTFNRSMKAGKDFGIILLLEK